MRKTQELQPKLKALQQQYSSRDPETQSKVKKSSSVYMQKNGVNPYEVVFNFIGRMPNLDGVTPIYFTCTRVETQGHSYG